MVDYNSEAVGGKVVGVEDGLYTLNDQGSVSRYVDKPIPGCMQFPVLPRIEYCISRCHEIRLDDSGP